MATYPLPLCLVPAGRRSRRSHLLPEVPMGDRFPAAIAPLRLRHMRNVSLHPAPIPRVRDHRHVTSQLNRCSRPEDGGQKEFAGGGEISTTAAWIYTTPVPRLYPRPALWTG